VGDDSQKISHEHVDGYVGTLLGVWDNMVVSVIICDFPPAGGMVCCLFVGVVGCFWWVVGQVVCCVRTV
jgi:hypothetical protein